MNKKPFFSPIYHYVFYALTLVAGLWLGVFLSQGDNTLFKPKSESQDQLEKISDIFRYIEENYVDSVEFTALVEDALSSILLHLDPHSTYISLEEFKLINEQMSGNFEGIGIQFRIEKDTVFVIQTIANGPSEIMGLKAGDRIIEVDSENIAGKGITNNEVMKLLKGKKGTKVTLGIKRSGMKGLLYFTITRDVIPTYSIDYSGMITPETGYIKLSGFNFNSDAEFVDALRELLSQGMKNLIFDLRGNGGGSLDASVKIADQFFDKGVLLVYTEGLHRARIESYSTRHGLFKNGKLLILVDEFSASASEIVAGAVQDNDRGMVIGRRTFGKGLVQEQLPFSDGSAIRLTVARYYTPVGRSIQRTYEKGIEAYYDEFYNRVMDEFTTGNDNPQHDSIEFRTKSGKIVYGGGGITPDIHVPYPAIYKNDSLNMFLSLIFQFSFEYADKNRQHLNATYTNEARFISAFTITENIWYQYLDFVNQNNKSKQNVSNTRISNEDKQFISTHLKANIGRNLFGYECYYPIIKDADEVLKTAIRYMEGQ